MDNLTEETIASEPFESKTDFEHEEDFGAIEEKHQVKDSIEKDLHLTIETEDFDEMSQLNPDAKEFVPVSPTRANGSMSSPLGSPVNSLHKKLINEDAVVAQSPRKGDSMMEDIQVPSENDFDTEIDSRPHEINDFAENGALQRAESPEVILNMKEALQQDDKLEQEYKDDSQSFEEENKQTGEVYKHLESSFSEYSNGFQNVMENAMNRSFYEGRDDDFMKASDVLNTVQPIPPFEDDQEADSQKQSVDNDAFESIMAVNEMVQAPLISQEVASPPPTMEFTDHSHQQPGMSFDAFENVQNAFNERKVETPEIIAEEIKQVVKAAPAVELQEQPRFVEAHEKIIENLEQEVKEAPEKILANLEQEVKDEPNLKASEVLAGAAVVGAIAGAVAVAAKDKPSSATKTGVKKTEVKAKAPAPAKTSTVPAKPKVSASAAPKAAAPKPSTAPASAPRPAPIRKILPTTTKPAPPKPAVSATASKPAVSSAPISRPKLPASTVPPVRKPVSATPATKSATDATRKITTTTTTRTTTSTLTQKPAAK